VSLKSKAIAGVVGVALVAALVAVEETRVARSRTAAADALGQLADARNENATAAADAARATAEAAGRAQAQLDTQLARENQMRGELAELARSASESRSAAERQIARLKRENSELAAWSATRVPAAWIAFVRGELTDAPAGTPSR
jgi:hypothetical protein